jgi:hypothetical protein
VPILACLLILSFFLRHIVRRFNLHEVLKFNKGECVDDEPKDWEIEDEEPPEKLKRKWFEDSLSFKETVECPFCRKWVSKESLACVYCGRRVFSDSGLLGNLVSWVKRIFGGK